MPETVRMVPNPCCGTLAGPAGKAAQSVRQQGLRTILTVSGILALHFTLIGGALGGARGGRVGQRRP